PSISMPISLSSATSNESPAKVAITIKINATSSAYYPAEEGENWPLMAKAKRRVEGAPVQINQDEQSPKRRG
ncbi:MAG: hypothetical protein AAF556_06150, partial [Pseudomonadota bacterium]